MTVRNFALAISPFYEWMLFCIQLIFCWGTRPRRYGIPVLAILGGIFIVLPWQIDQLHKLSIFMIGNVSVGHACMSLLSAVLFFCCFQISWRRALFQNAITMILQFLWFIVAVQFFIIIPAVRRIWMVYAVMLQVILYLFAAFYFRNAVSWNQADQMGMGRLAAIYLSIMIIVMLLYKEFNEKIKDIDTSLIYLVWCVLLYVLLYSVLSANRILTEKIFVEKLLRESEKGHMAAMQNAEIINQKCHDLKHQILLLRTINDEDRNEYISELEKNVMIYESSFQTGNSTLNVLLGEKKLLCDEKGIQLSVIGDASGLDFIKPIDLYTVLANALDNAIEAAEKQDRDNKLISINIARKGTITSIHIENTSSQAAVFKNGLPVTSKSDSSLHGIGVRSMRNIVEKYGGMIEFSQRQGYFDIDIFFNG